ncbi:MAG TPA: hypothetical protein RMG48_03080 [Myxococcales bacterium LLY-WYZ-16_1]|nr:hypothetical protein [Myxococcales bacterium LLY-WYZ-16_1]
MGLIGAFWGAGGVFCLLCYAVIRLTPIGWAPIREGGLSWFHWVAYAVSLGLFLYTEGYKAFQLGFSPRVAARAHALRRDPQWVRVLLAPAFCMGFFGATRRRMVVSWSVTLGIVGLVVAVRQLPQPWRGIVDLGVGAALMYGAACLAFFFLQGFGRRLAVADDVPEPAVSIPKVAA